MQDSNNFFLCFRIPHSAFCLVHSAFFVFNFSLSFLLSLDSPLQSRSTVRILSSVSQHNLQEG